MCEINKWRSVQGLVSIFAFVFFPYRKIRVGGASRSNPSIGAQVKLRIRSIGAWIAAFSQNRLPASYYRHYQNAHYYWLLPPFMTDPIMSFLSYPIICIYMNCIISRAYRYRQFFCNIRQPYCEYCRQWKNIPACRHGYDSIFLYSMQLVSESFDSTQLMTHTGFTRTD